MIDKFECEYLDVLTGICSQTGKGLFVGMGDVFVIPVNAIVDVYTVNLDHTIVV